MQPERSGNAGALPLRGGVVWQDVAGTVHRFTGAQMTHRVVEIASVLHHLGVRPGDRVAGLMGRRPATMATAMAALRLGAVWVPMVPHWGAGSVRARLASSGVAYLVTDAAFRELAGETAGAAQVVVVSGAGRQGDPVVNDLLRAALEEPPVTPVGLDELAVLVHPLDAASGEAATAYPHSFPADLQPFVRDVIRAGPNDLVLSTAEPEGAHGLLATGIAALVAGVPRALLQEEAGVTGWLRCLERTGATHLCGTPDGLDAIAAAGPPLPETLTTVVSVGDPLAAATVAWFGVRQVIVHERAAF